MAAALCRAMPDTPLSVLPDPERHWAVNRVWWVALSMSVAVHALVLFNPVWHPPPPAGAHQGSVGEPVLRARLAPPDRGRTMSPKMAAPTRRAVLPHRVTRAVAIKPAHAPRPVPVKVSPKDSQARRSVHGRQAARKPRPAPAPAGAASSANGAPNHETRAGQAPPREYLERLLRRVERYRYYPYDARRMRLQGSVEVKLTIDGAGHLRAHQCRGPAVLAAAACAAVDAAQPLPVPQASDGAGTVQVRFLMRYRLR